MQTENTQFMSFINAKKKILISLAAFFLYFFCFLLLYNRVRWVVLTLAVVPLVLFAYFYKLKYSILLCTVFDLVLILLMFLLQADITFTQIFSGASRVGIVSSYMIVIVTGGFSGMNRKLSAEIAARKAAENILQQRWESLKNILDAILTGIVLINEKDHTITYVNTIACEIIGLPATEITGKNYITVLFNRNEQHSLLPEPWIKMESRERILTRFDGTQIPIIGAVTRIHIQGMDYLLDSFQDLSYVKHIYNNLLGMQKNAILAERLASVGRMAAGMAHEINNPLAFIISNCDNLKQYVGVLKEFIAFLRSAPDREEILKKEKSMNTEFILDDTASIFRENEDGFNRIIAIMENLKRIDILNNPVLLMQTDFNKLISDAISTLSLNTGETIVISREFGRVPPVRCNPNDLHLAFYNIILNAYQAAKNAEKPAICISTSHSADTQPGENSIICTITDNGPGIEEAYLDKIFEPFFTQKDVGKGKGLGLTIAYYIIVNKYDGEITVRNRPGGGTEFTIRIPAECLPPGKEEK